MRLAVGGQRGVLTLRRLTGRKERRHQPIVDCLLKVSDPPKQWVKHWPMVLFSDHISV